MKYNLHLNSKDHRVNSFHNILWIFQSGLWSAISLAVPLKNVGTAIGIASLLLYGSSGLTNLVLGKILGHFHQ